MANAHDRETDGNGWECLDHTFDYLDQKLRFDGPFLQQLYSSRLITKNQKEVIENEKKTRNAKLQYLVEALQKNPATRFADFVRVLKRGRDPQYHVAEELRQCPEQEHLHGVTRLDHTGNTIRSCSVYREEALRHARSCGWTALVHFMIYVFLQLVLFIFGYHIFIGPY